LEIWKVETARFQTDGWCVPRHASAARADGLVERFVARCRAGDVKAVEAMQTEDAEVHSDGGGRVWAARVVLRGRDRASCFLTGVFRRTPW
jgi:RNA polymerase sigma-70 factor (ECF subfamily)